MINRERDKIWATVSHCIKYNMEEENANEGKKKRSLKNHGRNFYVYAYNISLIERSKQRYLKDDDDEGE